MKIICAEGEKRAGEIAAEIMAEVIRNRPDAVIGLATGSTPLNMYLRLKEMCSEGEISFSRVRSVNLDEYVGLSPEHSQSYRRFMEENLFCGIDIDRSCTFIPNGNADPDEECDRYDRLLDRLGRVDIQLLGIGHNGHIAFMEPSDHFPKDTSHVKLSRSTILANSRFFPTENEVPTSAISLGIGRILRSKSILLLVTGQGKAEILERALFGKVTPAVPASILQFYQGQLTVVGDYAALSVIIDKHPDFVF